ncbi:hypothetical protein LTR60_004595, partial [Cryomyces antarcticus]
RDLSLLHIGHRCLTFPLLPLQAQRCLHKRTPSCHPKSNSLPSSQYATNRALSNLLCSSRWWISCLNNKQRKTSSKRQLRSVAYRTSNRSKSSKSGGTRKLPASKRTKSSQKLDLPQGERGRDGGVGEEEGERAAKVEGEVVKVESLRLTTPGGRSLYRVQKELSVKGRREEEQRLDGPARRTRT